MQQNFEILKVLVLIYTCKIGTQHQKWIIPITRKQAIIFDFVVLFYLNHVLFAHNQMQLFAIWKAPTLFPQRRKAELQVGPGLGQILIKKFWPYFGSNTTPAINSFKN